MAATSLCKKNRRRVETLRRVTGSIEGLERVTQRKFHYPRLGKCPAVQPNGIWRRERAVKRNRCGVEPHGVGQVEGIGAETQRLPFCYGECLVEPRVDSEESLAAEVISLHLNSSIEGLASAMFALAVM